MNQHHACKEDNDSAGDNEKNSDTILLFLGESAGLIDIDRCQVCSHHDKSGVNRLNFSSVAVRISSVV